MIPIGVIPIGVKPFLIEISNDIGAISKFERELSHTQATGPWDRYRVFIIIQGADS